MRRFNRNVSALTPKSSSDEKDGARVFNAHTGASITAAAATTAAGAAIIPSSDKISANARSDDGFLPAKS